MDYKKVLDDKLEDDMKTTDRLERISSQIAYWGIDGLNEVGVAKWTDDIYWLIEKTLKGHKYGVVLEQIQRNIDDKDEIQSLLDKAFKLK